MTEAETVTERSSIADDLRTIHRIVDAQPTAGRRARTPWWGTPCEESVLELLEEEYGVVPDDVRHFYRTTDIATFGPFDEILGPATLVELREWLSSYFAPEAIEQVPEIYERNGPMGHAVLPMSSWLDFGCLIELGGPQHGRAISPPYFGDFWRTLAWNLADAVACIRELYEMGWYDWEAYPSGHKGSPRPDPQEELERLQPIFDRWGCNPVIAGFENHHGSEPERPTDR